MQLNGSSLPLYPPRPADPTLQPADALLRESTPGQSQYSPSTQHEQIVEAMARNGHYPACVDGDDERGHVTTRRGYQNIKRRVEQGLTTAVYVIHSARLGRDASERMKLARELRKLRVPIYSVQQGELRDDLAGGVYALMDQQFSVDLAAKMVLALPAAVKNGVYPVRTPVGYKREWPEGQAYDRKARPHMVVDRHYGPLVQQMFARYGVEGWTMCSIVRWLNSQVATHPNPASPTGTWSIERLSRILHNAVYAGVVEWGKSKSGYYDCYQGPVLRSGEGDCGPARHPALIDPALWKAVQMRLETEARRAPRTRRGTAPALLSGVLVCAGCGRPMQVKGGGQQRGRQGARYQCVARGRGQGTCAEPSCLLPLAEAAVLREVARLQAAHPWTPQPLETVIPADPHGAERAALEVQIAAARREIGKNIRLLKLIDDPDPDTLASFRRDNRALSDEIAALEVRRDALPRPSIDLAALEALRDRLARTDMAALIAGLREHNDVAGLRELVAATVQSARITERVGGARNGGTGWVRAAVEWTPDVALLLEHGCLVLGPAPQAPPMPSPAERTAARMRAYRARRRAQRAAPAPAVPGDLLSVAEAARVLGCSEEGIRAAVRRGTLGAVSLERRPPRTFITREEIERYRTTRLGKPGPKSGPKPQVDA